jgi:hypothetical protein
MNGAFADVQRHAVNGSITREVFNEVLDLQ